MTWSGPQKVWSPSGNEKVWQTFLRARVFLQNAIFNSKYRVPISWNPTRILRICTQNDDIKMHAKQHDRGCCYTLFWGKNCALSLRQTLQDEFLKLKICVYRKWYTRVFVNPCKPFAHALPWIMISSLRQLFLSYIHVWQSWLSANVVCKCHWLQQNEF